MNNQNQKSFIASKIDHAILKPTDGDAEVKKGCLIARRFQVASICVKPCHVLLAAEELEGSGISIGTVIGFPHGGTTTGVKYAETIEAFKNGAKEIDMVINIGKLIDGNFSYVQTEISFITEIVHQLGGILKVIIETGLLDNNQKITACKIVEAAGADYIKTSTGFSKGGATLEDVMLLRSVIGPGIKIKASGGIKTLQQAIDFINAGCERIGTSWTESILSNCSF